MGAMMLTELALPLAASLAATVPAPWAWAFGFPAAAYVVGSFPTAYLLGRAKGVDIRKHGSGNVGATNALRVLGKKLGIFCLIADMLKGAVPVLLAVAMVPAAWPGAPWVVAATALMTIVGHIFSLFLNFRGGKGVATTVGSMLALAPTPVSLAIAMGVLVIFLTRYVSVGSMTIAVLMPGLITAYAAITGTMSEAQYHAPMSLATLLAITIVATHRSNIRRLLAGTEKKLGSREKRHDDAPPAPDDAAAPEPQRPDA